MSSGEPIRRIAIAGDGIVAWSAAAALRRRMPWLSVALVRAPVAPGAMADCIASTLPSILGFHDDLALRDDDAVQRTGAAVRLGTAFEGWVEASPGYFHGYGAHGRPFGTASFQQHWIRAAQAGDARPFHDYSPAAALALGGRFVPPDPSPSAPLGRFEYGLVLDLPRYRAMMRALALHSGVSETGDLAGVERRADGGVAGLHLTNGNRVTADLFVDATGPAALLRAGAGGGREDWSRELLCDRVVIADAADAREAPPYDRVEARADGWQWTASAARSTQTGRCFSSRHGTPEPDGEVAELSPGTWERPWLGNCVAIGDAAIAIEPLEWSNLHLAHSAIDRIVAMLPDRDCVDIELAEYNRQTLAEARRVRDFVLLHYVTARRAEPFWQASAAVALPQTLEHTLIQFRERGRLPVHEEETFARDSWAAVLFGQGVVPRRVDPLIEDTDPAASARAMTSFHGELISAVRAAPPSRAFHDQQGRSAR